MGAAAAAAALAPIAAPPAARPVAALGGLLIPLAPPSASSLAPPGARGAAAAAADGRAADGRAALLAWRVTLMPPPDVDDADVEDDRRDALPPNRFERQGGRYVLFKPQRPGSRARRRRLKQELAQSGDKVDW